MIQCPESQQIVNWQVKHIVNVLCFYVFFPHNFEKIAYFSIEL